MGDVQDEGIEGRRVQGDMQDEGIEGRRVQGDMQDEGIKGRIEGASGMGNM